MSDTRRQCMKQYTRNCQKCSQARKFTSVQEYYRRFSVLPYHTDQETFPRKWVYKCDQRESEVFRDPRYLFTSARIHCILCTVMYYESSTHT